MKRKKLLSLPILLVFVLSVLNVNITWVSAVDSPYIAVLPENTLDLTPGDSFTVGIYTNYGAAPDYSEYDVTAYQFSLYYNPLVLNITSVAQGDIIVGGHATFIAGPVDNIAGNLSLTVGFYDAEGEITAMFRPFPWNGTLAYVTFTVVDYGASAINLGPQTKLIGWNFIEGQEYVIPTDIEHGWFQNVPTVTRDVAVTSVTCPSPVLAGEIVDITVVVENQGMVNEDFDVTVSNGIDAIDTKTVTNLIPGSTTSLTFTWNTAGVAEGTHTISATASTVPGETDTTDNTLTTPVTVNEPLHLPVAVITAKTASDIGEPEVFSGESSYDPDGGAIINYEWDFGDGETESGMIVTHPYTTAGIYTVTLTVTDNQFQVGVASHTISIEDLPPDYAADLVKWKAKSEVHHWKESWDNDGNVTLSALAGNLGTNANNVSITFAILDARGGSTAGPVIVEDVTLPAGATVPVDVEIDPEDYGYAGSKLILFGHVTLRYDSDGDGTPDTDGIPKIFRFSVEP